MIKIGTRETQKWCIFGCLKTEATQKTSGLTTYHRSRPHDNYNEVVVLGAYLQVVWEDNKISDVQVQVALATKLGEDDPETRTEISPNFVGDVEDFSGLKPAVGKTRRTY